MGTWCMTHHRIAEVFVRFLRRSHVRIDCHCCFHSDISCGWCVLSFSDQAKWVRLSLTLLTLYHIDISVFLWLLGLRWCIIGTGICGTNILTNSMEFNFSIACVCMFSIIITTIDSFVVMWPLVNAARPYDVGSHLYRRMPFARSARHPRGPRIVPSSSVS